MSRRCVCRTFCSDEHTLASLLRAQGREGGHLPQCDSANSPGPRPARMFCPFCGTQHFDIGEWKTRPHHRHLCLNPQCGKLFRLEGDGGEYFYGADATDSARGAE